jgi:uncharacterized protein (DUF1015 family)
LKGEEEIMSTFVPFRALRPHRRYVEAVASYPYDVLEEDEARKIVEKNPNSFLRVEKSEIDLPPKTDPNDERVFIAAKSNLERLMKEGIVFQEKKACFYVYGQRKGDHAQYGIVGSVSLAEYDSGEIKKHERTRPDKETERIRNIDAAGANTGLVFLVYRARESIDRIVDGIVKAAPEYDFVFDNGVRHLAWVVSDEKTIEAIQREFLRVDALYIADGHHRVAAAAAVARMRRERNPVHGGTEEYKYFVGALFPHTQARIMDYNRVVKGLNGLSPEGFTRRIEANFEVTPHFQAKSPSRSHEFGMYLKGNWFKLRMKEERIGQRELIEKLDVWLLQNQLLSPVLGIQDPTTDKRIKFIGGIRGGAELERLVNSGDFDVAFSMYPPALKDLMDISDAGQIMPPKSTWFEPKLLSGIFVHLLES